MVAEGGFMGNFKRKSPDGIRVSDIIKSSDKSVLPAVSLTFQPSKKNQLTWTRDQFIARRFRLDLYRFLRDNIPVLNSCIWTWSRLASAPGRFEIIGSDGNTVKETAGEYLDRLSMRVYPYRFHRMGGLESFLPLLFSSLFTDGAFAGFVILNPDFSGIERFVPIDPAFLSQPNGEDSEHLILQTDDGDIIIDGDDFYYFGLNADIKQGTGNSIMSAVPFIAYIEQQLIDDMRRTAHNAGYHRLHVKITPPEKMAGESDTAYVGRVNQYFDDTVGMIRDCEPDDNPVTWDNVKIEYIGPGNVRSVGNTWFLNHRAMIEEICSGTNLAPFMLGYSYGTTHNWAQFKFDLVMRQVISIQRQTARFLEWLGNMELALKGLSCRCRYIFDNSLSYLSSEKAEIERGRVDNLLKLYSAGLINQETAVKNAGELI
jgi:hypothetical protein